MLAGASVTIMVTRRVTIMRFAVKILLKSEEEICSAPYNFNQF